ncbi:DUF5808 domain-containing protein [Streptomyces sp. NPDC101151]|uniref:DUF5808 domain-containing protein n=1 Tax=Streptomyces sp. NPDC101151 TaxID=3366115 RepID=UPI003820BC51
MDRDERRYVFGIFCFDRDDPALLVPRRHGWGTTLNYGHPMAWVWTAAVLAVVGLIIWLGGR